jgi:hypothetical protein
MDLPVGLRSGSADLAIHARGSRVSPRLTPFREDLLVGSAVAFLAGGEVQPAGVIDGTAFVARKGSDVAFIASVFDGMTGVGHEAEASDCPDAARQSHDRGRALE